MSDTVTTEDLAKALNALSDLAKGKGQTVTTKDPAMSAAGGHTQVNKNVDDSDRSSWAGSTWKDVPKNGATDGIDDNGTDYDGGAEGMMKSILDKLSKGAQLTPQEYAMVKGAILPPKDADDVNKAKTKKAADMGGAPPGMPMADPGEEDKDKELADMLGKSLGQHAASDPRVRAGFEVSEFLVGVVDVMNKSLLSTEARIASKQAQAAEAQAQFNKSLAEAVNNLAQVLGLQAQRIEQVESTPAAAPRSVTKSLGGNGGEQQLTKSQILSTMVDLVKSGNLDGREVVRFETTGQIRPEIANKVQAALKS